MAINSKINIDVDASKFDALSKSMDKYKTAIESLPETFSKATAGASDLDIKLTAIAAAMAVQAINSEKIEKSTQEFYHVTTSTARHWNDLARSTKDVASNIIRATESLLKWTGIIGLVTGAGGLFGFDRMANSVMGQSVAAGGTGGNYGKRAAFLINFRRFGDPEGMIDKISRARSGDFEALRDFRNLGMTDDEIKGGDVSDAAAKAFQRGSQRVSKPGADRTFGLDPAYKAFSLDQLKYLQGHPGEVGEQTKRYSEDSKKFDVSPGDQKAYTDLVNKLDEAGKSIETTFVKGLVPLADPIKRLSKETVNLVRRLMVKDGPIAYLIDDLAEALKWVDGKIADPKFNEKVEGFIGKVSQLVVSTSSLVKSLAGWAKWLGISSAEAAPAAGGGGLGGSGGLTGLRRAAGLSGSSDAHGGGYSGGEGRSRGQRSILHGGASSLGPNAGDLQGRGLALMNHLVGKGWTPEAAAIAAGNAEVESGIQTNPRGSNDHGTSAGLLQWHNDRMASMHNYVRSHPGMSEFDAQADYVDADPRWNRFKHVGSLDDAGNISHSAEGYSTNSTAARVAKSHQWLSTYKNQRVTITSTPGGNTVNQSNAAAGGSP